jgi:glucokinase
MASRMALGVDVGGTNIRLAVVDGKGHISERTQQETRLSRLVGDAKRCATSVVEILEQAIRPMLDRHRDIRGVGIGFPGFFDEQSGLLLSSPNIPGLRDVPLAGLLTERLKRPVRVQNDAALAALGEFRFGIGAGHGSLLHLTLGTGIGGGAIIDGKLYGGDGGMAMEIGHLHVAPEDRLCGCGARGCMETWASASAVAERFAAASGQKADAREVCRLADAGNIHALNVLHDAGRILGRGIAESVKLLDIRRISISGGLTGAWQHLAPAMQQELDDCLLVPLRGKVRVQRSALGDDAGILGAAALVFDHHQGAATG